MQEVLILGNGISRLLHEDMIESWTGELWATNYSYLEYGHKITRLTGHVDVLAKAMEYRDEGRLSFSIWTGNLGRIPEGDRVEKFTCPPEFWKDSGTVLIAQALAEGFDRILMCGYDHGGRDIYTLKLHERNKTSWVNRLRGLAGYYAERFGAVEYVGFDHKPYILSDEDPGKYYQRYVKGLPHIPDPDYIALSQLLYGDEAIYGRRRFRVIRVKYITGQKLGFEAEYNEEIAQRLAGKGEVEIIGVVKEEKPEEPEVAADMKITARMGKDTLIKIAELKGIEIGDPDAWTKAEIREIIEQKVDPATDDGDE